MTLPTIPRRAVAIGALFVALVASGCGGPDFVKVTGRVTHKGQPVPSTQLRFMPDNGERPSTGLTDDDGNFTVRYSHRQAGAPPGSYTVFLTYVPSNEEENHTAPPKASKELKAVIAKYGDPKTSPLHYEITKNGQVLEITLE
jgi:hypothetical protein